MHPHRLDYHQFLSLGKLFLGNEIEYDTVVDLNDAYRGQKTQLKGLSDLNGKIHDPSYMRPQKTKFRTFNNHTLTMKNLESLDNRKKKLNLSYANSDKKMLGIKFMVDNISKKMNIE